LAGTLGQSTVRAVLGHCAVGTGTFVAPGTSVPNSRCPWRKTSLWLQGARWRRPRNHGTEGATRRRRGFQALRRGPLLGERAASPPSAWASHALAGATWAAIRRA